MSLDDELRKVRAKSQAAADQAASMGSTARGVLEASLRASLDHSLAALPHDLARIEEPLGAELDGGSFLMGMMAAAFVITDVDITAAAAMFPDLFNEYIEKARQR